MSKARPRLAIINRSFWPIYPVIGEALLRFAEQHADTLDVSVIMQDHADIRTQLATHGRGQGVTFYPCKALSVSRSSVATRILDAVFFMVWVFLVLVWKRPSQVYVSTDPPVLVPFVVMCYCRLFGARYTYHLQDIHPEATNVAIPVNGLAFRFFRWLDGMTMRHASLLITITDEMAAYIRQRSATRAPIEVLSNPSVAFEDVAMPAQRQPGFTFCGNAGRLQRMPLLLEAIRRYTDGGGRLPFVFAGGGVYAADLKALATRYDNVEYLGLVSARRAAEVNAAYQWALLPIEDEVTLYAFPSKSSSYVYSGAFIAAICGAHTSVASWVRDNRLGMVIDAQIDALVDFFRAVERGEVDTSVLDTDRSALKDKLSFEVFVAALARLIVTEAAHE